MSAVTWQLRKVLCASIELSIKNVSICNGGYSSAGRAVALQAKGRRFDPVYLHQTLGDYYVRWR